ncbi:MAG: hypothetical protein KDA24_14810 [Deltaproteobacteria bacterium]|nr:hypothetical protein [Deltaproteobacteria bacterium]
MRIPSLLLLTLLAGCSLPNLDTDPLVVPGTGETEFFQLTAGLDDLVMTRGVQGGTHLWGAARVTGLDWREVTIRWSLTDADDDEVTESTSIRQALQPCTSGSFGCEPGMGEVVAVTVVLDSPSGVRGDELTMTVEATDEAGRTASASSAVRPVSQVAVE